MSRGTLVLFLIMYAYGFGLMLWAIFLDKHPTALSVKAAKFGLAGLILTVLYFIFMFGSGMQKLLD